MESVPVTRLSSKGQLVIPQEIRDRLGLKEGCRFIVLESNGNLLLKVIEKPDKARIDKILKSLRKHARDTGLKPRDVTTAIAKVRGRARKAA